MRNRATHETASRRDAADDDPARVPLQVGGVPCPPGAIHDVELLVARLPSTTRLSIPVRVVVGREDGPRLFLSAALHGDELNGIEIVRRVVARVKSAHLRGALLAAPLVNVYGFLQQSRYLPDGRDLNRSFPGSSRGSLAARLAHLFLGEIVANATHGIDLHTATRQRTNLPQIRADLEHAPSRALAEAFGAPVTMNAATRDGSLRAACVKLDKPVLLFEAGEALRFDEDAIRVGTRGVLQVMAHLGMIDFDEPHQRTKMIARDSRWVRAPRSGMLRLDVVTGDSVTAGQRVGEIADAFGDHAAAVRCPIGGIVVGRALNPAVHKGDGILNVAIAD